MREQMVDAASFEEAYEMCPWASVIEEVCGGYNCWESTGEFDMHYNQYDDETKELCNFKRLY